MPIHMPQLLRREIQAAEHGRGFVAIEPAAHGVLQRLGLLEDLLEHVVRKAAQFDVAAADIQSLHVVLHVAFVAVDDAQRVGRDHRQFVIGQVDDSCRCGRPAARRRWRRSARRRRRRRPAGCPAARRSITSGQSRNTIARP